MSKYCINFIAQQCLKRINRNTIHLLNLIIIVFLRLLQYPELNAMIMRRFQEPGDVEKAFELVHKSQGLDQTRFLARKHCVEAVKLAQSLAESPYQKGLQVVCDLVLNRMK